MTPGFWRGRRVLITGHTGFKGSWLGLWLSELGAEVTGYALDAPTRPSLFEVAGVGGRLRSIIGDVRDLSGLDAAFDVARPQVVLHLAAQSLVRESYDDPVATLSSNVMGTVHVCEAVRRHPGVQALLCVTSDKCYANREWPWAYRENDAMGGHDPYSASKGCAELVAASYRDAFFPPHRYVEHGTALATARAGNVIGGGDWARDRLVPDLLRAQVAGESVPIRRPDATRPWQHVLDALSGYLLLAERLCTDGAAMAQAWNFGPAESDVRSVRDVAQALAARLSLSLALATSGGGPHEAGSLRLDSAKARQLLGWRPVWALDEALARVADWHLAWRAGRDMQRHSLRQIHEHMTMAEEGLA